MGRHSLFESGFKDGVPLSYPLWGYGVIARVNQCTQPIFIFFPDDQFGRLVHCVAVVDDSEVVTATTTDSQTQR